MNTLPASTYVNALLHTQADALTRWPDLWVRLLAYRWARRLLRRVIKNRLARLAQNYLAQVLMLKGLLADVAVQTGSSEWANAPEVDAVMETLQKSETMMLQNRASFLKQAASLSLGEDALLRDALSHLIALNADAFEAAQTLRWALMELQADADIQGGRTLEFDSAQAAMAHLGGYGDAQR